jgi:hypothetical protein
MTSPRLCSEEGTTRNGVSFSNGIGGELAIGPGGLGGRAWARLVAARPRPAAGRRS